MPEVQIQKGQILTPDKKDTLVGMLQSELQNVNILGATSNNVDTIKNALTTAINNLLSKKGIITPQETNTALDAINDSKKQRLQQDYVMGVKRGTFYIVTLGVIALTAAYIIIKKRKG